MATNETLLLDQISQLRAENAELARRLALKDTALRAAADEVIDGFRASIKILENALDNP